MSKSEFPETWFTKYSTKYSWLISPIILIFLVATTLFIAQGLQINIEKGNIDQKGSIHIKDVQNGNLFIDGNKVGSTSELGKLAGVYDSVQTKPEDQPITVKVTKPERNDWVKTVKVKGGFVNVFEPIMYPNKMNFDSLQITAHRSFIPNNQTQFFYDKIEDGKLNLYRYSITKQIFLVQNKNEKLAEISSQTIRSTAAQIITSPLSSDNAALLLKNYNIIPSKSGLFALLIVSDEKIYIISENGTITQVPNIVPNNKDKYEWNSNDSYLVYENNNKLYAINPKQPTDNIIYKPTSNDAQIDLQFVTQNEAIFKLKNNESTDLISNTLSGGQNKVFDLPNIENIRKDNIKKVYSLIEKENSILIQTDNNIYLYNITSSEMKKFNKFDGEELVYVDYLQQVAITKNTKSKNQFRYYSLEQNESKTFTIDAVSADTSPNFIYAFNYSQSLALVYDDRIIFSDIDGANIREVKNNKNPSLAIAVKNDVSTSLVMFEKSGPIPTSQEILIKFENFDN